MTRVRDRVDGEGTRQRATVALFDVRQRHLREWAADSDTNTDDYE